MGGPGTGDAAFAPPGAAGNHGARGRAPDVLEDDMTDAFSMDRMVQSLEDRRLFAITTSTEVVKVPGPTDVVLVVGTNPAGKTPPGQGDVIVTSNRLARKL